MEKMKKDKWNKLIEYVMIAANVKKYMRFYDKKERLIDWAL